MTSFYRFETEQGVVRIRLDSDGQIVVDSPRGPMVMDIWTLEDAFVDEFDELDLPEEDLRSVYRSFARQHPAKKSPNASEMD